MNSHEFEIYLELYKRKEYSLIPIGQYPNGNYFYMTNKQIYALELLNDDTTTHVGYGGSARSGKSVIECTAIIFDCFLYPDIAWGLARKELTTLKRTVLITLFNQLNFYGIKDSKSNSDSKYNFNYNQQLNKLSFNNLSEVFLIDTMYKPSDPLNTRFGGFELTKSAIDESNETDVKVVNKLFERTGWRNNDKYKIKRKQFECFNPDKNHVYRRFWIPFRDKSESVYKKFIRALPTDNPNPAVKEWVNDIIRTGDTSTIERQIHGNFDFDDDPSRLCEYDAICDIFTNDHVKKGEKRISSDLAMQGRDRFVSGSWEGLICTIDIDKKKATGKSIEEDLKAQKTKRGVGNSRIIADSDGLGAYLDSYIKNIKTFHGGSSPINKTDYGNIKDECAFKLAEVINNGLIKINCTAEQAENIKQELSVCLKRDNIDIDKKKIIKKDKMKELLGHSPDYMDMLLMGMWFELIPADSILITKPIRRTTANSNYDDIYGYIKTEDTFKILVVGIIGNDVHFIEYSDGLSGEYESDVISSFKSKYDFTQIVIETPKGSSSTISCARDLGLNVYGMYSIQNQSNRMFGVKENILKHLVFSETPKIGQELLESSLMGATKINQENIGGADIVAGLFAHLEKFYRIFD